MSKNNAQGKAEKPQKAPKPKKEKAPKAPKPPKAPKAEKKSLDFSPVATAMFEIQRREATGNVVSGLTLILLGIIAVIVSIAKYIDNMKHLTVEEEKIFAYAWIVIAVSGIIIGVIGVYEILKSFISMEQINEWAKNAESHASPFQGKPMKRQAAEMNQSQSTEPAPAQGMAEDGSHAKKHFAWLGKKEEKKPDSAAIYNKYNPQEKAPEKAPENKMEAPPKAKPLMEQKFDYGIHEAKKQTFADKFLAENKEDPFAQYRKDLGMEEEAPEEFIQKPQFIRSAEPNHAAPAQNAGSEFAGGLFEQISGERQSDDDGFFTGTTYTDSARMQQQLDQVQQQIERVAEVQKQISEVQQVQQQMAQVRDQLEEVKEQVEHIKPKEEPAPEPEKKPAPKSVRALFGRNTEPAQSGAEKPAAKTPLQKLFKMAPPDTDEEIAAAAAQEAPAAPATVSPPPIPEKSATPTITPPPIPEKSVSPTIKPPPIPEKSVSPTIKPPPIPEKSASPTITPPPIPEQPMAAAPSRPDQQMPPIRMGYPQNGYGQPMRPMGYQPMQPVQNMYQPLPNLQGMMPNQGGFRGGYVNSPFGFAGAFVDQSDNRYNPAMPPYTVHPFRPANVAAPQMQQPPQEQAYNSQMPPYTVHPFRPANVAAPQMQPPQEQAYNSQMPPYTVHPFRPANVAAPQMQQPPQEQAYNSQMPPYTVHPFRPANVAAPQMQQQPQEQAYNSQMPPYTVHPFKPSSGEITAPQVDKDSSEETYNPAMPPYTMHPMRMGTGVTPPPIPSGDEQAYNSQMPPYTVHAFKAKDPTQQPLQPQLFDNADDAREMTLDELTAPLNEVAAELAEPEQTQEAPAPKQEAKPEPKQQNDAPAPQPQPAAAPAAKPEQPAQAEEQPKPKRTQRGPMTLRGRNTQRGEGDKSVKKAPITQRLGEYTFSLFEELSGAAAKAPRTVSPKSKKTEENNSTQEQRPEGGKEMAFNLKGGNEPERKKSFSERFLNKNGKKATQVQTSGNSNSPIVQNGTPAQRKFVDASEYDEWVCPGCGSTNQEYVGVCSCGERKPRNAW